MLPRPQALEALSADPFDVVVIGGGITGAGVALDAASRGYSVALVERDDYAVGTSSRSSKMVHGGLRYLQNFDLGLVREALLERQLMVQLAPHLVYPTPFLVPTLGEARRRAAASARRASARASAAGWRRSPRRNGPPTGIEPSPAPRRRSWSRPSPDSIPRRPTSSTTARPTTSAWC
jgi:glycerol-3-phosphate dehydrogenase